MSSEGGLAITAAARRGLRAGPGAPPAGPPDPSATEGDDRRGGSPDVPDAEPVDITARAVATKADLGFEVRPGADLAPAAATGRVANPKLALALRPVGPAATTAVSGTVDQNYTCAVPRNDPGTQVYQPHWRQVEWAVDQLVFKNRLNVTRPTGWKGPGCPPGTRRPSSPSRTCRAAAGCRCRSCSASSPRSPTSGRPSAACWRARPATR